MPHRITTLLQPGDLKPGVSYVIAANHESIIDPFVICSVLSPALWRRLRSFRFFAYNGLFRPYWLRMALLALGCFPAREHQRYVYGLDAAASFIARGQTVVIFPQGKRTLGRGRAHRGVEVLARMANVRVIPAHIEWQKLGKWRRGFRLTIGQPLDGRARSADQLLDAIYGLDV
ncbi:MAG TPA: lysophospholipid acyltransferase family protein [Candidatus Saccharimonas sp.]|nr:lysophospholipid acyltransferase family protein [Candidatus Saccharimonas sp.]